MHQKIYAPPLLQLGFEVNGSESADVDFTSPVVLRCLISRIPVGIAHRLIFGSTYGIDSELYRPFSPASKWFFASHASARNTNFKIYRKSDPLAEYRFTNAYVGGDIGYGFSRSAKYAWATTWEPSTRGCAWARRNSPPSRTGATRLHYLMDHTDDPVIPRRGVGIESTFHWYDTSPGATNSFPVMVAESGIFPSDYQAGVIVRGQRGWHHLWRNPERLSAVLSRWPVRA